jgi:hypothetical protein
MTDFRSPQHPYLYSSLSSQLRGGAGENRGDRPPYTIVLSTEAEAVLPVACWELLAVWETNQRCALKRHSPWPS